MHKKRTKPKILYKIAKDPCIGKNAHAWVFLFIFSIHLPRSPPFRFRSTAWNDKREDVKMNINQKEIGQRIAKIRTDYSLTQEQFANILNTSCSHISKIEIGAHGMSLDLIADISVQFNVSTDYILLGKDTHSYDTKIKLKFAIDQLNDLMKALWSLTCRNTETNLPYYAINFSVPITYNLLVAREWPQKPKTHSSYTDNETPVQSQSER